MDTPLLASDGDASAPSLSSVPIVSEESEFSRLIAQVNPLNALTQSFDQRPSAVQQPQQPSLPPPRLWVTIAAGTLIIFHVSFVWGSYMSDTWSQVTVQVAIGWQRHFLPSLNDLTTTVLESFNLASLFSHLASAKQYWLLLILWVTSLLLPCIIMVLSPSFIVGYHHGTGKTDYCLRRPLAWQSLYEMSVRWAGLVILVWMILELALSSVNVQWADTYLKLRSATTSAQAAYCVGIVSAVASIVIMRVPHRHFYGETYAASSTGAAVTTPRVVAEHLPRVPPIRSPPPHAFGHRTTIPIEEEPLMTLLEDDPPVRHSTSSTLAAGAGTPDLVSEAGTGATSATFVSPTFRQRVLVYQIGLLTVLLWAPAVYMPLVRISYTGIAVEFMESASLTVFVWQIPTIVWRQGAEAGTPVWILLLLVVLFAVSILIIPVAVTCLSLVAWLGTERWSRISRSWLYVVQPAMGCTVFAVALFGTTVGLQAVTAAWNPAVCNVLNAIGQCLGVRGHLLPGAWFFALQSILLETFVLMTLQWS